MHVSDAQLKERRLMMPSSYKGRGGNGGSVLIPVGDDVIEVLLPAIVGRPKDAPCSKDGAMSRSPTASSGRDQNAVHRKRRSLLALASHPRARRIAA